MSFHELEDFVEDAILLVNQSPFSQSEKRNLVATLYRFQQAHDTGYTHFRVYEVLKEIHFLYEWPIERHPDFTTHKAYFDKLNIDENPWISGDIGTEAEIESVFVREINGQIFLYFDAGDAFWERVKDQLPPKDQQAPLVYPLPQVFLTLFQEAERQQDRSFMSLCYAVWVNGILEFYLDEQEGVPDNFIEWLRNETLLDIRKLAVKHQTILEYQEEDEDFLLLPDFELEKELATSAEEEGKIAFLLDFDSSLEELAQVYRRDIAQKEDLSQFERVYTFFRAKLDSSWEDGIFQIHNEDHEYTFLKKIKEEKEGEEAVYACLIFQIDPNMKVIACKIGIQNGLILQWQNRAPAATPQLQHFVQDIALYLSKSEIKNNSYIGTYGVWIYDVHKSDQWLTNCLENLWQFYEKYSPSVYAFYKQALSSWGEGKEKELMKRRVAALEKCFNFFGNEMDFKLALARLSQHLEEVEKMALYVKDVEALLGEGLGSEGLQKRIKQGLAALQSEKTPYPEISHIFSNR